MPVSKAKEHLYEIDLMRALIILGVICVHVISFFNLFTVQMTGVNLRNDAALTALHFTREAFMFITGLVLFITYYGKPFNAKTFLGKRLKLIAIPYFAFTLLYMLFTQTYMPTPHLTLPLFLQNYGIALLTGNQFFLYYLLISLQLYIIFPWLLKFIKATERYHGLLFGISFALEIALMWFNKFYLQMPAGLHLPGLLGVLVNYRDRIIITYQFWFIAGALVAVHYSKIKAILQKYVRFIPWILLFSFFAIGVHVAIDRLVQHQDESQTVLVLQPLMIPYSLLATVTLWSLGMAWSRVRLDSRFRQISRLIKTAAAASFGIFLIHPFFLHLVQVTIYRLHTTAAERVWLTPVAILFVYFSAMIVARLVARIPYLSYIVGQKSTWHSQKKLPMQRGTVRENTAS